MFLEVDAVLTETEVIRLRELARKVRFYDGRASNPANVTKKNLQAELGDPSGAEASTLVFNALSRCREFRDFAFPVRVSPPMLAQYTAGMQYGLHADAAFLPMAPEPLRSDVSLTVFIADPETYEGGELVVHLGNRTVSFKGKPGSAVFYPSTTLHEVSAVTSGARLVSIGFVQSQIPDQTQRNLLYELNEIAALEGNAMSWESRIRLEAVRYSLQRQWSRPE